MGWYQHRGRWETGRHLRRAALVLRTDGTVLGDY